MPTLMVAGGRVRCREEAGPKGAPVLVLLHMAGGGSSVFGPLASRLGRSFRVLAPDFPAHGQSDPVALPPREDLPGIPARLRQLAAWTVAFLDAFHVERAVLAGHSMGGCVALTCALEHRSRVAGLGLVCTSASLQLPEPTRRVLREDYENFVGTFTAGALPLTAASSEQVRVRPIFPQADKAVVQADFAAVDGFEVSARLGSLRLPAVVASGADDRITPPRDGERLAGGLGVPLHLLEGGHLLPREQPALLAEVLSSLAPQVSNGTAAPRH